MDIKLESLRKAITSLEKSIRVFNRKKVNLDNLDEIEVIRAGVIQVFEYTYELSWKFMKRWLEANVTPDMSGLPRKEFYRICAENKLILDVNKWFEFHSAKNQTLHIYNHEVSEKVFEKAIEFLPYSQELIKNLEERV